MKKYIHEELIRFDGKFRKGFLDFYGPFSPLDERGKKEFLDRYYQYYTKKYGDDVAFRKAVTEEDARRVSEGLHSDDGRAVFDAYLRKARALYKNWYLYTDRARIADRTVSFSDEGRFPVPCAKYEYNYKLKRIRFSVRIGKEYFRPVFEGLSPTLTGRTVEFRKGCKEILKLFFSPDGFFCYKDGSKREYHYETKIIGTYDFDKWNDVEIVFGEEQFSLSFKEKEYRFGYSACEAADTIFLGGGMQPAGDWAFRSDFCEDGDGMRRELFAESERGEENETFLGKVALPFGIGTEKHRDQILILRKKIRANAEGRTVLSVSALDPGGEVSVNGKKICRTDGVDPFTLDLTPHLTAGENQLEISVFPRAPEVLYPWHRHRDYYNAWYCGGAKLGGGQWVIREPIEVFTEEVSEKGVSFRVFLDLNGQEVCGADYAICLKKCFPEEGESVCLKRAPLKGTEISESFTLPIQPWDTDAPVLYAVSVAISKNGVLWEGSTKTGFRTICQKGGNIYLNGKKIVLKGALNMQFLPPYENVPVTHVCPEDWEIVQQVMAVRAMNGNCLRQHQLGYGCNDGRFASVCDRLGVLLIWTTRLIDSAENMMWTEDWKQAESYRLQMKQVINHPSIIMWEGSNELHSDLQHIDRIYDAFVQTVKSVDTSRLICPVSHLYYGGGIYECGCKYYNTDGTSDESGNKAASSFGWRDESVVRSAHTYCLLLGYGCSWRNMATQNWKWQRELFDEPQKAYLVSEFAVIGRQNPETPEAKRFINKNSYELNDEKNALGFCFADDEWKLSQAFQALCADVGVRQLLKHGADGMLWCCLWGGANNASYLKSVLDFYGYKKLVYYKLGEMFQDRLAFNAEPDVLYGPGYEMSPVVCGLEPGERFSLKTEIFGEDGKAVWTKEWTACADSERIYLKKESIPELSDGYYTVRYTLSCGRNENDRCG